VSCCIFFNTGLQELYDNAWQPRLRGLDIKSTIRVHPELGLCSVAVSNAGVVDSTPSMSLVVVVAGAGSRSRFLGCLFAPTGILFLLPQRLQLTTRTSAHGFLPSLLWFTISCVAVRPGTSTALQLLHIERFRSTERRSCAFRETV
jgi:hypothetical protein